MDIGGSNRRGSEGSRQSHSKGGRGPANGSPTRNGRGPTAFRTGPSAGDLDFTFFSNYDLGHDVQKRILEIAERHGFAGESFFALRISLEEALVNAIKHGNRLDPRKKVHVEAHVTDRRAEILVEDEGAGFDRTTVPDPTCLENLEKCSGRGILLIESYMTEVRWDRGGRRLRMVRENLPDEMP
jgi:serine/threonine-protein kinase RsbW